MSLDEVGAPRWKRALVLRFTARIRVRVHVRRALTPASLGRSSLLHATQPPPVHVRLHAPSTDAMSAMSVCRLGPPLWVMETARIGATVEARPPRSTRAPLRGAATGAPAMHSVREQAMLRERSERCFRREESWSTYERCREPRSPHCHAGRQRHRRNLTGPRTAVQVARTTIDTPTLYRRLPTSTPGTHTHSRTVQKTPGGGGGALLSEEGGGRLVWGR
jgi:hypothetical protein